MKKRYVVYWDSRKVSLYKFFNLEDEKTFRIFEDRYLTVAEAEAAAKEIVESKRQSGDQASLSIIKRNPEGESIQIINKKGEL
tara:strand:+ start:567 stop:815 length:249 start_codon:yes stop_codon:yes gene_type:complete